jgi:transposase
MNFDSGNFAGKRKIQKGRHDVRRHLYMPILGAATQSNSVLKNFYDRLTTAGKPPKVALVACMRKLVVYANTLLRKGEKWKPMEQVNP